MTRVDDVRLASHKNGPLGVWFPMALSRALRERGYNRARLSITDGGILLSPYVEEEKIVASNGATLDLPEWGAK